jgi:hypothetical protein
MEGPLRREVSTTALRIVSHDHSLRTTDNTTYCQLLTNLRPHEHTKRVCIASSTLIGVGDGD